MAWVERFNGRISDLVKQTHFASASELDRKFSAPPITHHSAGLQVLTIFPRAVSQYQTEDADD